MLIMKGLYTGYTGNPEEGLQLLAQRPAAIDRERDPRLAFHTLHNILLFRVELGEFEEAQRQIRGMRPLYAEHAGPIEQVKLRGIEGKIAAGLGDLRPRRSALPPGAAGPRRRRPRLPGRPHLPRPRRRLHAARQEGRGPRQLVDEMVATFRAVGVEREAMAAMLMLTDAVEQDQTTLELLALVSGVLQRLQTRPGPACPARSRLTDLLCRVSTPGRPRERPVSLAGPCKLSLVRFDPAEPRRER